MGTQADDLDETSTAFACTEDCLRRRCSKNPEAWDEWTATINGVSDAQLAQPRRPAGGDDTLDMRQSVEPTAMPLPTDTDTAGYARSCEQAAPGLAVAARHVASLAESYRHDADPGAPQPSADEVCQAHADVSILEFPGLDAPAPASSLWVPLAHSFTPGTSALRAITSHKPPWYNSIESEAVSPTGVQVGPTCGLHAFNHAVATADRQSHKPIRVQT